MGLEAFIRAAVVERNRRFSDPAFQRKLALEKANTLNTLHSAGEQALEAAAGVLLKAPFAAIKHGLSPSLKMKDTKDGVLDSFGEFTKGAGSAAKCVGSVFLAAGKGTKWGIRRLIAK